MRFLLVFILVFTCNFSIASQKLVYGIESYPSYEEVLDFFYENHSSNDNLGPTDIILFGRTPSGWEVFIQKFDDLKPRETYKLWTKFRGFKKIKQYGKFIKSKNQVFSSMTNRKSHETNWLLRAFKIHTYYGYDGWADDIINELEPNFEKLAIADIYSLGRAYSAKSGVLNNKNRQSPVASKMPTYTYYKRGNSWTEKELSYYHELNGKAIKYFNYVKRHEPGFKVIVGKISTKAANEHMQAYLDLILVQNKEVALRSLRSNIYDNDILDHARNYLMNCPKDAILFTNGDNDTYPVWYVQETENYRTDVQVLNLSLLSSMIYINMIIREFDENQIKLSIKPEIYGSYPYLMFMGQDKPVKLEEFIEKINTQKISEYKSLPFSKVQIDCDEDKISDMTDNSRIFRSTLFIFDVIHSNPGRPVCFTENWSLDKSIVKQCIPIGIVDLFKPCSIYESDHEQTLEFFNNLHHQSYQNPQWFNIGFEGKTNNDSVVIQKLYWQLVVSISRVEDPDEFRQYIDLWETFSKSWHMKPAEKCQLNYDQIVKRKEEELYMDRD